MKHTMQLLDYVATQEEAVLTYHASDMKLADHSDASYLSKPKARSTLYIMTREAVYIRIILEEMGNKQPPTPLQTENSMADAVCNGKIQPKQTKAMGMRFHWLNDRECQEQFHIYWRPGKLNYADYWTNHHQTAHHQHTRKEFLTPYIVLEMLRLEKNNAEAAAA